MRLRIEPDTKPDNHFFSKGDCVLPIHVHPQQANYWCWSAIAVAFLKYFNQQDIHQSTVVEQLLCPSSNNTKNSQAWIIKNHDKCAFLSDTLIHINCYSHWSPNRPSYQRICEEIYHGHPICLRLQWTTGDSHYVTITAVYPALREIGIEDSAYGTSIQSFDHFPSCYQGVGALWRETYWTKFPEAPAI